MFAFHAKMFLDNYYLFVSSGVDKAPADPVGPEGWGANVQNTKICCGFFQTGFCFSDRRQYSERYGSNFTNNYRGTPSIELCGWHPFSAPLCVSCSFNVPIILDIVTTNNY